MKRSRRVLTAAVVLSVVASGCGGSGTTSSVQVVQTSVAPKPPSHSQPPPPRRPERRHTAIIDSFEARLVNQHVVRLHWGLARPAALTLTVRGVRHGNTKNQTVGGLEIPPSYVGHPHPARRAGTHRVNFEFGEYNFQGYDRLQFRLRARSPSGAHDTSHPIVLSRSAAP